MMFLVLEKACEDDYFMMTEIWKNGNTWVNYLLRILAFNDSCSLEIRKGETNDKFDERVSYTITEDTKNGTRTTQFRGFDVLLN